MCPAALMMGRQAARVTSKASADASIGDLARERALEKYGLRLRFWRSHFGTCRRLSRPPRDDAAIAGRSMRCDSRLMPMRQQQ